jgi:cephalosporin hydroxylase
MPSRLENGVDSDERTADRAARATGRYLDLLRDALLDEHYLENELRIEHLLECVRVGRDVDFSKLGDPVRYMAKALDERQQERRTGELRGMPANGGSGGFAYAGVGRVRLDHLRKCLESIRENAVVGDLVESGTRRGGAGIFMRGFLEVNEMSDRRVWIADRFDGREAGGVEGIPGLAFDISTVREGFARFRLLDEKVVFLEGPPARTLSEAPIERVALLRIDSRNPEEIRTALGLLYGRVAPGGFVVIDGYGAAACQDAVDEFRSQRGVAEQLERIDWSAAAWRKTPQTSGRKGRIATHRAGPGAAEGGSSTTTKQLGVVVVVHNMRREARRTLHSLSRSYQQGVDDLDYEVIVVENGSEPEQRLGEEFVRSFGSEFRYIDLGEDALPSPARAVNRGIAASDAPTMTLMIDGAHLLTPGVLHYGMLGSSVYAPAVVTAKQWFVGPGQQPITVASGYDGEVEDQLLAEIDWPTDGYRLFEISHFIGNRDWFDGDWESNCVFLPRALIEQVGPMDEAFSTPGGGFVNLDFFERMVSSPGVSLVTILGEGSFHQVHGGTTTNASEPEQLVRDYGDQYEELRGRRFYMPGQEAHYVGRLPPAARRVRPRPMTEYQRFKDGWMKRGEKLPSGPAPIPEEMKKEFIEAFWRSGERHRTTWLGRPTHRAPTDLIAYQELICRVGPEWIVETRTGAGGRALFLASICDLLDEGQVLSIDGYSLAGRPDHRRITYLRGDPAADSTAARVRGIVGEPQRSLLILGGASAPQVFAAYRNLAPLVPVGSYVVVEDTIFQANPVWPDFGMGPAIAVQDIVREGDFVRDPWFERFALTFNVGGFLKRVR